MGYWFGSDREWSFSFSERDTSADGPVNKSTSTAGARWDCRASASLTLKNCTVAELLLRWIMWHVRKVSTHRIKAAGHSILCGSVHKQIYWCSSVGFKWYQWLLITPMLLFQTDLCFFSRAALLTAHKSKSVGIISPLRTMRRWFTESTHLHMWLNEDVFKLNEEI